MGIVDHGEGCRCLGAGGIWEISVPSAQLCCKPNTAQTNTNSYKSNNNKHTPPCMIQDSIQRRERRPQFSWMALLCIQVGWLSSQSRVCFPSLPFAYSATNTWWAPTRNKAQGEERKIWRWTRHEHGLWRANGLSAQTQTGNFHAMDKVQWRGSRGIVEHRGEGQLIQRGTKKEEKGFLEEISPKLAPERWTGDSGKEVEQGSQVSPQDRDVSEMHRWVVTGCVQEVMSGLGSLETTVTCLLFKCHLL